MSKIKLLVEIDEDEYKIRKEMAKDGFDSAVTQMIVNGIPYNPTGDCISREYIESIVRAEFVDLQDGTEEWRTYVNDTCENILNKVDNAPTVEYTFEEAFQKTVCENRLYCPARPQGECVDISKLRLMTVEECAGHTIDYAMGWKACIEWIKKGGAE